MENTASTQILDSSFAPPTNNKPDKAHLIALPTTFGCIYHDPTFWQFVDELLQEIEASPRNARKRKQSSANKRKFRQVMGDILLALIRAQELYAGRVIVCLNSGFYSKPKRYNANFSSYRIVRYVYDGLLELGYIAIAVRGYHSPDNDSNKSYSTRIQSTGKLTDALGKLKVDSESINFAKRESIILRKKIKTGKTERRIEIDYIDTPKTCRMRNDLGKINSVLMNNEITFDLTDDQFHQMQLELCQKDKFYEVVDLNRKQLHRIFTGDFKHGGRFYGAFWHQIGSKWRQHITINGNRIIELD